MIRCIYIYTYMSQLSDDTGHTHTHEHTHIFLLIFVYLDYLSQQQGGRAWSLYFTKQWNNCIVIKIIWQKYFVSYECRLIHATNNSCRFRTIVSRDSLRVQKYMNTLWWLILYTIKNIWSSILYSHNQCTIICIYNYARTWDLPESNTFPRKWFLPHIRNIKNAMHYFRNSSFFFFVRQKTECLGLSSWIQVRFVPFRFLGFGRVDGFRIVFCNINVLEQFILKITLTVGINMIHNRLFCIWRHWEGIYQNRQFHLRKN